MLSGSSPRPVVEVTVRKASGAASISASRVARGSNQVSRPAASSRRLAWRATSSAVPWKLPVHATNAHYAASRPRVFAGAAGLV
jgi:hypothetical protein